MERLQCFWTTILTCAAPMLAVVLTGCAGGPATALPKVYRADYPSSFCEVVVCNPAKGTPSVVANGQTICTYDSRLRSNPTALNCMNRKVYVCQMPCNKLEHVKVSGEHAGLEMEGEYYGNTDKQQ